MSRKKTWDRSKHFLTPLQAAELLNTCQDTIYRGLAKKELIGIKLGRAWRLPASQFKTHRILANDGTTQGVGQ